MIEPYLAVALQTSVRHVLNRDEVEINLNHIGSMIDLVTHICSLELPVRLIALGEGAIQGFVDEILDMDQAEYTEVMAARIPGPETDFLAEKAKAKGCFLLAQLKTQNDKYPGRFFNTVFLIDPNGDVIWQHQKNIVLHVEHSTTPHDVYDEWIAEHGDTLEAFFPVAKTEIGNIAGTIGVEGAFPECYRAFAMNGAEILYRGSLPEPWVSREIFETQNRARAMDNTAYMIATNTGTLIMPGAPGEAPASIDGALGGRSAIYNYRGEIQAMNSIVGDCYVASPIDIEALRHYRENARFQNWLPYLKTELFSKLYAQPLWPKNQPPMQHADADKVFHDNVAKLIERGSFTKSGY
ncbi:MAG: hydrolase [Gammaproteobacteria bacterium]|nr:MAG: hydrolase [Gammaproteobacteria bacterium]